MDKNRHFQLFALFLGWTSVSSPERASLQDSPQRPLGGPRAAVQRPDENGSKCRMPWRFSWDPILRMWESWLFLSPDGGDQPKECHDEVCWINAWVQYRKLILGWLNLISLTLSTVDYSEKPALQVRCQRGWQQTGEIKATHYNLMQIIRTSYIT